MASRIPPWEANAFWRAYEQTSSDAKIQEYIAENGEKRYKLTDNIDVTLSSNDATMAIISDLLEDSTIVSYDIQKHIDMMNYIDTIELKVVLRKIKK